MDFLESRLWVFQETDYGFSRERKFGQTGVTGCLDGKLFENLAILLASAHRVGGVSQFKLKSLEARPTVNSAIGGVFALQRFNLPVFRCTGGSRRPPQGTINHF